MHMVITRDEFREWCHWFGSEVALQMVMLKFMQSEEARVRFAKALLPDYKIER